MSQAEQTPILQRVRLVYARREALRYVSHLDMQLVWERTLRRAGVRLAYSQGFNPRPRMHMASALPLGFLSRCEILDFWVSASGEVQEEDLESLKQAVQQAAPPGLEVRSCQYAPLSEPALQTQVKFAEYLAQPLDPLSKADLEAASASLQAAESLPRERRGKPYDLRPLIAALEVREGENGRPAIYMQLSAQESATGRPEEVLDALGLDASAFRVERLALILG